MAEITGDFVDLGSSLSKKGGYKMTPIQEKSPIKDTPGPCSYNLNDNMFKGPAITIG